MNRSSSLFLATIHFTCHVFSHGLNQVVPAPFVGTCASSSILLLLTSSRSHALIPQPEHHPARAGPGPDFGGGNSPRRSGPDASGSRGPEPGGLFNSIFGGLGNNNINGNNDRSGSRFGGGDRRSSDPTSSRRNRRNNGHNDRYPPGGWSEDLD